MELKSSKNKPPIGAIIVAKLVNPNIIVKWEAETQMDIGDGVQLRTCPSIARYLARSKSHLNLYGGDNIEKNTEIDHWLTFTLGSLSNTADFKKALEYLESILAPVTFLVGDSISIADYVVFGTLYASGFWMDFLKNSKEFVHLKRWYKFIQSQNEVQAAIKTLPKDLEIKPVKYEEQKVNSRGPAKRTKGDHQEKQTKDEGKFVELEGAEMGKVIVRFPPEASGYLHIGHAKASLLNQHYQQHFQGKLIMRFDDTNPAKEKEEYEEVILEDLKLLKVKYDHFSRTSDHFETILAYGEKLIKDGNAYVDDTDAETMKAERETRTESKNRNNSVDVNMKLWDEMKGGTEKGQKCAVRAKMNMNSDNGCMRDPAIYRCKNESHPSTGTKYKVYPTYDFACPIVDSIEGVTHALRTTEYMDRDEQFNWFINALGIRKPNIWAYSRLNLTHTVMSKRKLTWLVDEGIVSGWDDPRLPTVRGILRRGMTVEALKMFIIAQGSSRSVVFMEWDKIWAMNKKVIDPVAPRFTTVDKNYHVTVNIKNVQTEAAKVDKHPKDPEVGQKTVWRGTTILIDGVDAESLKEGENTTFINWGNMIIEKIHKQGTKVISVEAIPNLDNKDFKKTLKVTWLAKVENQPKADFTPAVCIHYDHIISKPVLDKNDEFKDFVNMNTETRIDMIGDPELKTLKKGEIIQIQRRGFFIVDQAYAPPSPNICKSCPITLIAIPDGSPDSYGAPGKKASSVSAPTPGSKAKGGKSEKTTTTKAGEKGTKPVAPAAVSNTTSSTDADKINEDIVNQGNIVRDLKSQKAGKDDIKAAVDSLLELKTKYKSATGNDWKPGVHQPTAANNTTSSADPDKINEDIVNQGNKVRDLKSQKAGKDDIKVAVDTLLELKNKYKSATGNDWKPGVHQQKSGAGVKETKANTVVVEKNSEESSWSSKALQLHEDIKAQGEKVRNLKAEKADKEAITTAVDVLKSLKTKFKTETGGIDWKPDIKPPISSGSDADKINEDIVNQGNKVRDLKSQKAGKDDIKAAVDILLELKNKYKSATGNDWKPGLHQQKPDIKPPVNISGSDADKLNEEIANQGNKVRDLKSQKAGKDDIKAAVDILLELKSKYKSATGNDWKPPNEPSKDSGDKKNKGAENNKKKDEPKKKDGKKDKKKEKTPDSAGASGGQKVTRLGLEAKKEDNLADWYSQIIVKAEMLEYYDVSGCYILRPWAFSIWEAITKFFDAEIKKLGVSNCYFPCFVSQAALQREKDHIADFAPEVAWVTKSGDSELAEPIAIRPTSETVMYPAYAKWIQSYRDLPLKLNQWNNVVRWEFKHPQPFLRTREFLWQEGHTAFATFEEAKKEVLVILDLYRQIYEDLLAIPVVRGKKTEKEKFAGGDYTTTVEAYIASAGRAIQGATSHHLGQNFSKMFEIVFEDPESGEKKYVYQNSWGITTRTLGVLIMVHGDNKGLVLPPKVACIQVVIVPCGISASLSAEDRDALYDACKTYEKALEEAGVRVKGDYRENYSPPWKYNHWELKGVPIRMEVGPRDVKNGQVVLVRRDNGQKLTEKVNGLAQRVQEVLEQIQSSMFKKARNELDENMVVADSWKDFVSALDKSKIIQAPFCGNEDCEDKIKDMSKANVEVEPGAPSMGAKSLCIPFIDNQLKQLDPKSQPCVFPGCKTPPQFYTLFGRSY